VWKDEQMIEIQTTHPDEKRRLKSMRAEEFDKKFDDNQEDIVEYLDLSTLRRPNQETKSIQIDVPAWMIKSLD